MLGFLAPMVFVVSGRILSINTSAHSVVVRGEVSDVLRAEANLEAPAFNLSDARHSIIAAPVPFSISAISSVCNAAKVVATVVRLLSVDMVDVLRPFARRHAPYYAMGKKQFIKDSALSVSMVSDMGERLASREFHVPHLRISGSRSDTAVVEPVNPSGAPPQNAARGVVFKKLVKNFSGKIGFSHSVLSERSLWLGLAGCWNTPQARYFSLSYRANAMAEV